MQTSYFAKYRGDKGVSIAGKCPDGFKGRQYKKLAPKYWFFKKYKEDNDEDFYTERYKEEVLAKLDPKVVYAELGSDAVLLCWEAPGKFCHRHLVAQWLSDALEISISEFEK